MRDHLAVYTSSFLDVLGGCIEAGRGPLGLRSASAELIVAHLGCGRLIAVYTSSDLDVLGGFYFSRSRKKACISKGICI